MNDDQGDSNTRLMYSVDRVGMSDSSESSCPLQSHLTTDPEQQIKTIGQPAAIPQHEVTAAFTAIAVDDTRLARLLGSLGKLKATSKKLQRVSTVSSLVCLGLLYFALSAFWRNIESFDDDPPDYTWLVILFLGCLVFLAAPVWITQIIIGIKLRINRRRIARMLPTSTDRRMIGPTVELLHMTDRETRRIAVDILTLSLPTLRESDCSLLNADQRTTLNNELHSEQVGVASTKLKLAILAAYMQVGDQAALEAVRELVYDPKYFMPKNVYLAAKDCLPTLRLRADRIQSNSELLRPSAIESHQANTLLRTVTTNPNEAPVELLRCSIDDSTAVRDYQL